MGLKITPVTCYFNMFITVTLQPTPQSPDIRISHADCFTFWCLLVVGMWREEQRTVGNREIAL